jgi:hypothetical protein
MAILFSFSHLAGAGLSVLAVLRNWRTKSLWALVAVAFFVSLGDISQDWGVYHYYIGSKYFNELGYFDLYECSILTATTRRDLHTYGFRHDEPDCEIFQPERWADFRTDLYRVNFSTNMLRDKGFNATPAWVALSQALIAIGIPLDFLLLIDPLFLLLSLNLLVYAVGWRQSAYIALFTLLFIGTTDRLWGHYMQWLWIGLSLLGVALLQKRSSFAGGVLIGIASGLYIFPIGLSLFYIRRWKVLTAVAVGLGATLLFGMLNSRGFDGYIEFVENMSIHSSYIRTEGCCNIGLASGLSRLENDNEDYLIQCFLSHGNCETSYPMDDYNSTAWVLMMVPLLTSPMGIMFGMLTLSKYYWLILSVVVIWYGETWARWLLLFNGVLLLWLVFGWHSWQVWHSAAFWAFFVVLGALNLPRELSIKMSVYNVIL